MNSTLARPARRLALTLAAAGIAAMGSVALAPAASAAPAEDGPSYVIDGPDNGNGPDAFIVRDHGRVAVFFCDLDKPNQHQNNVHHARRGRRHALLTARSVSSAPASRRCPRSRGHRRSRWSGPALQGRLERGESALQAAWNEVNQPSVWPPGTR